MCTYGVEASLGIERGHEIQEVMHSTTAQKHYCTAASYALYFGGAVGALSTCACMAAGVLRQLAAGWIPRTQFRGPVTLCVTEDLIGEGAPALRCARCIPVCCAVYAVPRFFIAQRLQTLQPHTQTTALANGTGGRHGRTVLLTVPCHACSLLDRHTCQLAGGRLTAATGL